METTIELFRIILEVYRKYDYRIDSLFKEGPQFHVQKGYRFITDEPYSGLRSLETPYGSFRLCNSGETRVLKAIQSDLFNILGQEITHVNGKPVEETGEWNKQIYEDEMKKHLHLIYDPEGILKLNYHDAKIYYVNELKRRYIEKYKKPYDAYTIQMFDSPYRFSHLVGLSVELYNQI